MQVVGFLVGWFLISCGAAVVWSKWYTVVIDDIDDVGGHR